jgi:hypothetical protein
MKQHGWQVWYQPEAVVTHHGGASSQHRRTGREADLYRSRVRFFRKHYGDWSAEMLKALLFGLTAVKIIVHGWIRFLTDGRYGRPVVPLHTLMIQLKDV